MRRTWYLSLVIALLVVSPNEPFTVWQASPSPTTEQPMPDPCERAPRLPFCN